jgi:hypothetical protein
VQRNWLMKLHTEKGLAQAVNLAGLFIMSSQGNRDAFRPDVLAGFQSRDA